MCRCCCESFIVFSFLFFFFFGKWDYYYLSRNVVNQVEQVLFNYNQTYAISKKGCQLTQKR